MISYIPNIAVALSKISARLKYKLFFAAIPVLLIVVLPAAGQTGPGGVGNSLNNLLWLKADAGTSTVVNGATVTSWLDQSGNAMNATQAVGNLEPKYVAVSSANRPALLFNNQGDAVYDYLNLPAGFSDFTAGFSAFVVVKPIATTPWSNFFNLGGGFPNIFDDAIVCSRDNASGNMWYQVVSNGSDSHISGGTITNGSYQIISVRQNAGIAPATTSARIYKNGNLVVGPVPVNIPRNVVRNDNYIGRDSWGSGEIDAEFGEIIIYNYLVNSAQRVIVVNYLSSKYGIAILNTIDKYFYDGAAGYGSDVAGIGKADATNFHSDATSAGILNISSPSSFDPGDYLLCGHNNGSVASWSATNAPSDLLNMSFLRIARAWRADKTGDVGTVTITGDYSALPALPGAYPIRALLVDSDGDFSSGALEYPLTDIGSNRFQVTGVTLNDGDYLTFAIYNVNNDAPCNAYPLTVSSSCNFQLFSNEGATGSGVADPGNCDGMGSSGYSGADVWFQAEVAASGNLVINTHTQSTGPSDKEWANRVGIAVYSGTCGALTKVDCQVSPSPASDINLTITGRTPGETLFLRMWEYGNDDNGKFRLCVYDDCLLPPVITGSIPPSTIEGCDVGDTPAAANTVAALELLGLNITDGCTPDASLTVTHSDSNTGLCPIVITRRYTVADPNGSSSSYDQTINIDDTQAPVIAGSPSVTNIEGCNIGAVPAALTSVAQLEALPGGMTITDACTPDAGLVVTSTQSTQSPCPIKITRVYTITDACGNSSQVTHVINVNDTQPPVVTGTPDPLTVEGCSVSDAPAAATGAAALQALPGVISVSDVCTTSGALTVSHTDAVANQCPVVITRTYTITDACSNSASMVQTIYVDDTQGPVINGSLTTLNIQGCSSTDAPAAVTTVAGLEALAGGISVSDACTAKASLVVTHADVLNGTCPIAISRTYTITDDCGNSSTVLQTININDTQAPLVNGTLSDSSVEGCSLTDAPAAATDISGLEALTGGITVNDGCTASGSLIVNHTDVAVGLCPIIVTRTYTITDDCGNSASIIHKIIISDTQAPSITGSFTPLDIQGCDIGYIPAAASDVAELEALPGGIFVTDACSADAQLLVTYKDSVDGRCPIKLIRTYTVKDLCSNKAEIVQLININDTQVPVITGALSPLTAEGCGGSGAPLAATTVAELELLPGGITVSDNCTDNISLDVNSTDVPSGHCPTIVTRTYTVADGCGNVASIVQMITVDDTQPPVISGSPDLSVVGGCTASDAPAPASSVAELEALDGGITITDACTAKTDLVVTYTETSAGSCPLVITRIYTVTDNCGNSATVTHVINMNDTAVPVVSGSLNLISIEGCSISDAPPAATSVAELEALPGGISVADACTSDALLSVTYADSPAGSCPVVVTRTYTVTDNCGNHTDIVQQITINDTQAPVITGTFTPLTIEGCYPGAVPAPETTIAGLESLPGGISVADACTPDGSLVLTSSDNVSGQCPNVITRTYTIKDQCNNSVNIIQTINIDDTQPPVITGSPDPVSVEGCSAADAPASATSVAELEAMSGTLSVADLCSDDESITVTSSDVSSGSCPLTVTRTYVLTDKCGNTSSFDHTIYIQDTTAPVVTGTLSPQTIEGCSIGDIPAAVATADELETLPGGISVSDECTPHNSLNVTSSDISSGTCPLNVTRTYTITDACGNSSSISQTIYIDDTQPPVISGSLTPVTIEGCSETDAPSPETTVAGLESLPGAISVADVCTADAVISVTSADVVSGSCPTKITRTYEVTDVCGNSGNIIQIINILDTQAPVVAGSLLPVTVEGCSAADAPAPETTVAGLEALAGGITITDACTPDGMLLVTSTDNSAGTCPVTVTRTYTIADECGNHSTVVQTINVDDTTPPVVAGSLNTITVEGCNPGAAPTPASTLAALEALPGNLSVSDVCTPGNLLAVTSSDAASGTCPVVITRTYTITDQCGNSVVVIQTINVDDTTAPVVSGALSDQTVEGCDVTAVPAAAASVADLELLPGGISISDACTADPLITVTYTDASAGTCPIVVTRTYTVTDQCGNSTVIIQKIFIDDTTPPAFTAPPDIIIYKDAFCNYDASVAITGDVTDESDNCSSGLDATFADDVIDGLCEGEQIIIRTWSLTDDCNNTTTNLQIITVRDNIAPTFTAPPDITINKNSTCGYNALPAVTGDVTDEMDNCDPALDAVYTDAVANGSCQGEQIITRTWSLTDDCGNTTTHTQIITVTDITPPTFTAPPDIYICRNADCTYDISTLITGDVINEGDNCSTGLNATFADDVSGAADCDKAGVVLRVWSLTDNCGNAADDQVQTIYINPVPGITIVPDDGLLCYSGQSVDFTVGTPNTMVPGSLWRYDVTVAYPAGVTGSLASGLVNQAAGTLSDNPVNSTNVVQTVSYTFTPHIKSGGSGAECGNGTPVTVTIDIDPRPRIAVTADQLICYNGNATFSISTVNSPLHTGSLWRYDVTVSYPAGVTGLWTTGLSDQTANTLTDSPVNSSDQVQTVTYTFTPHIMPGDGGAECGGGVPVIISVDLDPQPKITVTTDQLLCHDGDAVFSINTVNKQHTGSIWRYDVTVAYPAGVTGNWVAGLTNQTAATLTDDLTNTTDIVQTVSYTFTPHISPADAGPECGGGIPVTITVDLDPQPKINVTTDQLLCFDGDATFTISTVNSPIHSGSQWRYDVSVIYPSGVTGSWASGLTNQTLNTLTDDLTNNTDFMQTVTYVFTPHIRPGDGGSECGKGIPVTLTVNLDPKPKITVTTDPLLCFDGDATFFVGTVNALLHPGSQWLYDVSVAYPAGVTGSWAGGLTDQTAYFITDDLTNTTNTVQTVYYTFTPHIRPGDSGSECFNGTVIVVRVDLDPQPRITAVTPPAICFDGNAAFNISTVNTPLYAGSLWRYDVIASYPAGVTGSWSSGIANQTSAIQTDVLNNSTDVVQTVVYTFTPHIKPGDAGSECNNGVQLVVNVLVNPRPRLFPIPPNSIQCDSTLTSIVLQSPNIFSSGVITFDQTVNGDGSIQGYPTTPVTGLPDSHTIADRLVNLTDSYHFVTYRIIPVSPTGCANGAPVDIRVTVNPTPRAVLLNPNMKRDSSICTGGNTRVVLTSPTVMTSGSIRFDYDVSVSGAPGIVTGNTSTQNGLIPGYTVSYPYQNSSDTIQSVYYHVTPKVDNAICVPGRIVTSEVKIHAKTLQNLIITQPLTCDGGSDAALRAVPSKGAGLYYFDWIRTSTDQVHGYGITDLVNRKGGRWDVKVTDNLGCQSSAYVFVEGAFLDSYMYVVDTSGYGTTCNGSDDGEIWIYEKASSTGIPPFEYWVVRNSQDTLIHSTLGYVGFPQQKWYNLPPGTYKLYMKDSNGCYNLNYPEAVLTEPAPVITALDASKYTGGYNTSCKGYSDGSVWISSPPTGGNGGYRFKWFTYDGVITGADTLNRIDDIPAGTYYLRTTDRKGCSRLDSMKIAEPPGMVLAGSDVHIANDGAFNISCNGGNDGFIKITITGGSGNYTYSWSGPGSFSATTRDIANLKAGTYVLTARDVNGCILMPQPEFVLTEPPPLAVTGIPSLSSDGAFNINCFGSTGSVDVAVTGGISGTYQYAWSTTGGSGIIQGQEDQSSLGAGNYHLIVKDQNLCESSYDVSLTQPSELNIKFAVTNITCQAPAFDNGSVDLTVTGGVPAYSWLWSEGSTSEDISGLTDGYYKVTVTDINGCQKSDSALVSLPPPITYNKQISDYNHYQVSCYGMSDGSVRIEPTNGEAPYIFSWSGPDGFASSADEISGLKAGDYILNITDRNFCTATDTIHMVQPQNLGMTIIRSYSDYGDFNINCAGDKTGTIDIEPVNAAGLVTYLWSDGASSQTRTGIGAGTYGIIITDGNGCQTDSTVVLTQPDSIKYTFRLVRPYCPDMTDGQITVDSVSGGVITSTYNYLWSDGSTGNAIQNIGSGRFTVTVTDLNGCAVTTKIKLEPINDLCLIIPEAFSPNNDLINDYWNIGLVDLYPEVEITIYNRWGEEVWKSARGYPSPWDGTKRGQKLPIDSYHYIIDLHNGSRVLIGNVTIVR